MGIISPIPLASMIILAYNHEKYIYEAIKSAFAQTYKNLEIIISDDASTDGTWRIIQELAINYAGPHKVYFYRNAHNLGLATHINSLIDKSKGEFIIWCGGDDISLPNKVEKLLYPMIQDQNIAGVHSDFLRIDINGNKIGEHVLKAEYCQSDISSVILNNLTVYSQSHAFRKKVFTHFGPMEPFVSNEGNVITLRELYFGKIVHIKDMVTKYRMGSGTSTYSGKSLSKLIVSEPLKVVSWRLTSLKQHKADLRKFNGHKVDESLLRAIEKEIEINILREQIIKRRFAFNSFYKLFRMPNMKKRALLDFIKRNTLGILISN